jgi:fucose permease
MKSRANVVHAVALLYAFVGGGLVVWCANMVNEHLGIYATAIFLFVMALAWSVGMGVLLDKLTYWAVHPKDDPERHHDKPKPR